MPWILAALVLLASFSPGQELKDLLPHGMSLDGKGRLQWAPFPNAPCGECDGKGKTTCHRCKGKEAGCVFCTQGSETCSACAGKGRAIDPYLSTRCFQCLGYGVTACPKCRGRKKVITDKGNERVCPCCQGAGTFTCPLCTGSGRLPLITRKTPDPRRATADELKALRARLHSLPAWREGGVRREPKNPVLLSAYEKRLAEIDRLFPLPPGQVVLLRQVVEAMAKDEEIAWQARGEIGDHHDSVLRLLGRYLKSVDRSLWRLRRNGDPQALEWTGGVARMEWKEYFGGDPKRPEVAYCLLGCGLFRSRTAGDITTLVRSWLQAHPQAKALTVSTMGHFIGQRRLSYVWVLDGKACLNHHLIEQGCILGGTQVSAKKEIEIPFKRYLAFLEAARKAEAKARKKKVHGRFPGKA